ncbi:MAG: hypothetical protein LQ346_004985 [Caloplaca aetnensis]|nr:MAG: hypothetical protein LQ346_004985 [Caloplaca aetnensis]
MHHPILLLSSLLIATSDAILVNYEANYSAAACSCTGTNDTGPAAANSICRDPRLGPVQLPIVFPLLSFVSDYDRFGGQQPGDFLTAWTDQQGRYRYPPQNGFVLDLAGKPILGNMSLLPGTQVDRFGSEYADHEPLHRLGSYISAADAPYAQRALPPSNLATPPDAPDYPYNYRIYTVLKRLDVLGGPIAPWFGQPGLGVQFYTGGIGDIRTLVARGYPARDNATEIVPGPNGGSRCG